MDMETFVQLTEATLKMGFGAMIAALSSWFILRNMQNKAARENRRLQILEEVSSQVGTITHTLAKYSSLVVESIQYGERWPAVRKKELETINNELVLEFKHLAEAEAKLLMLGEKNLELTLRAYGAKIAAYRRQVYAGRKDITPDQISSHKQTINQARELFYELLSRKYDRLLANA